MTLSVADIGQLQRRLVAPEMLRNLTVDDIKFVSKPFTGLPRDYGLAAIRLRHGKVEVQLADGISFHSVRDITLAVSSFTRDRMECKRSYIGEGRFSKFDHRGFGRFIEFDNGRRIEIPRRHILSLWART